MKQATFQPENFHSRFVEVIIKEIPNSCRICLESFRSLCIYVMKIKGMALFPDVDMSHAKSYVLENTPQLLEEVNQKLK